MGNTNITVIHIPKLKVGQYLFSFDVRYYLKTILIYRKFLKSKRTLPWQKTGIIKNLKIEF